MRTIIFPYLRLAVDKIICLGRQDHRLEKGQPGHQPPGKPDRPARLPVLQPDPERDRGGGGFRAEFKEFDVILTFYSCALCKKVLTCPEFDTENLF